MSALKLQVRRDTSANWTNNNPTLLVGELGFELDTRRLKIATSNNTPWNSVEYIVAAASPHQHGIGDIDATGTPTITKFLRGDGSWSHPVHYANLGNVTGTVNLNCSLSSVFHMTLTGNVTLDTIELPQNPPLTLVLRVEQGGSGNHQITWNARFKHPNNEVPEIGTATGDAEWFLLEMVSVDRIEVFKAHGPYRAA